MAGVGAGNCSGGVNLGGEEVYGVEGDVGFGGDGDGGAGGAEGRAEGVAKGRRCIHLLGERKRIRRIEPLRR